MWYVRAGTKVTGPFLEEQLRMLRKRGQFSPIHQISIDRIRWESAASLVKLLDAKNDGTVVSSTPSSRDDQTPPVDARWYYLDEDQQKIGPLTLSTIRNLIQGKAISPRTQVCARGETEWTRASDHPDLSSAVPASWRWFIVGFTIVVCLIVALGVTLIVRDFQNSKSGANDSSKAEKDVEKEDDKEGKNADKTDSESADKTGDGASGPKDPLLIRSLKNEEIIQQAIGLVVCGERWKFPDGDTVEDPPHDDYQGYGTGTCFAISSTGFLLTNRHVVAAYSPPQELPRKLKGTVYKVMVDHPVIVFFNRIRFEAKVMHISQTYDLAVLKIERMRPQPYFGLSRKNTFHRGGKCFAMGFPAVANKARSEEDLALLRAKARNNRFEAMLLDQNFDYSYQGGEVSRVIRDAKQHFNIEHSAKIFRGNSGGPLVDDQCTVIGINTLITSDLADTLYIAFATGQFKQVVDEFTGASAAWQD